MKGLEVNVDVSLDVYLLRREIVKLKNYTRKHDHANTVKQKTNKYAKLIHELETRYKDIAKNMEYSPMMGCNTAGVVAIKKGPVQKSADVKLMGVHEYVTSRRGLKYAPLWVNQERIYRR